jgi:hypothetical protein
MIVFARIAHLVRPDKCHPFVWMLLAWFALPLLASAQNGLDATIGWDSSISTNVAGYKVYYGTSSRNYTNVTTVDASTTSLQVFGLQPGTAYFCAVKSVDSSNHESAYSTEVYFVTPSAPTLAVKPWSDAYGNRYVEVTTKQSIPRYWELDYTLDLVDWYPYDYGYDSFIDEPYVHTDWDFLPQMFFRVIVY